MPGVYAKRLYARTHTSGRTKSVQDAPTTNDHDCRDAKPLGVLIGIEDSHYLIKTDFFYKLRALIFKALLLCKKRIKITAVRKLRL